ncbi:MULTISPECIES: proline dehydrogenase family protein [unclassified Pseudodesulfovibrio]|uniref:proline dehydrogenase family protein n=1 Tax=unclassified Pseudodesulfovibrio TaxID=2661612 RepID=UPI000FEBBB22|nr:MULTISPECIES: proline dehydrogenase family protein [unclassified Pseudodesulfovibrio]MCJ2166309.1 proline dehydrogenase family protein [Pseudodesulfovibrio sp. S3-i]RWU02247.1 proline dehydrogenase [Pseudodesulfovibrio sp. S3]
MLLWQKLMIAQARSKAVTRFMQGSSLMTRFARQFVGGADVAGGLACARKLKSRGVSASLFYLGEYVDDPIEVQATLDALIGVADGLGESGLDVHMSVDPTQVGSMISWEACRKNVFALARSVSQSGDTGRNVLMLDMEDSSVTEPTLGLYQELLQEGLPAAVTVQAYLHRTSDDLEKLVEDGAMVRLVKGAFAESGAVAVTGRRERDDAYRKAIVTLLSSGAREQGVYPVFGTHDHGMVEFAAHVAEANGWQRDQWEVEMLLGVRPDYQRELVAQGVSLRLYLPFGRDWWPYSIRRVGENPKNLGFVVRSMMGRG